MTLAVLVSACGGEAPKATGSGADCFPKEAARWLTNDVVRDAFAGRQDKGGPVTVYIDSSGSMAGYLAGATEAERPLHDLIATIPDLFPPGSGAIAYKAFGSRIRDVGADHRTDLLNSSFFTCRKPGAPECDNTETRLDIVMREIEGHKDDFALVVTDMWFADPGSETSGLVPLASPLEHILESGRSIAVYGIAAPFSGKIYDLPGGGSQAFAGKHPLIVLAIGTNERVRQFSAQLARSSSAFLARGMNDGSIHQAVFTLDPSSEIARSAKPLQGGGDPRVRPATVLKAIKGVRIQQFRIERSAVLRKQQIQGAMPAWRGPDQRAFQDKAVWQGPYASRSLVWQRNGERCAKGDWSKPTVFDGGWQDGQADGQKSYQLDPAAFTAAFRRPGIYLVTGEVARTSLSQPNPATAWFRDWSFSTADGAAAGRTGNGAFFRTLNLAEFARLLENALADAAEHNPGPITGFTFAVEVAD